MKRCTCQSMYHSTETALKITNDILMNQIEQYSTTLVAIDLSQYQLCLI